MRDITKIEHVEVLVMLWSTHIVCATWLINVCFPVESSPIIVYIFQKVMNGCCSCFEWLNLLNLSFLNQKVRCWKICFKFVAFAISSFHYCALTFLVLNTLLRLPYPNQATILCKKYVFKDLSTCSLKFPNGA